ncbi:unnamed protein product [Symbiodinium natans]|uniref:Uncharacterized protein n=1 Tax=Symbiodinium natans TaxID=878477 RepID=A0A812RCB2_9DINO|nr:unnamed protein product [Symbiodinium natans]
MEGEEEDMGSPSAKTQTEAPAANTTCWDNLDPRLLPVVLTESLLCSAICWFFLQCPLLSENGVGPLHVLRAGAAKPFVLAFCLMIVPEGHPDRAIERSCKSSQFLALYIGPLRGNHQRTATCSGVSQDGTSIRWESLKVRYVQRLSRIRERRPPRNMRGEARSDGVRRHAQLNVLL